MSRKYSIIESPKFKKQIKSNKVDEKLYQKIKNSVYPFLNKNPFAKNNNIKKLHGDYKNFYRYRIGDYRLFYEIDNEEIIILILSIKHRKDSY